MDTNHTITLSAADHRKSRLSACAYFLIDGMIFGTWATLIPSFKAKFQLDEGQLGIALFGMVIGALISMPLVGQVISRRGSRPVLLCLAPAFCVALVTLALAPAFVWLVTAALLFGAVKGAFDVTINSQAIAVENAGTKPIMATFQALWSSGGLIAALFASMALKQGVSPLVIASTVAISLACLAMIAAGNLISGDATHSDSPEKQSGFKLPNQRLIRIGVLACMALFAEGVMMDWSAVYTKSVAGAADWLAPVAYGVFSLSMAGGRLSGDYFTAKLGPVGVLKVSGTLTTIGLLIIVLVQFWPATFVGLLFSGVGLSNLVPVLFGAGGRAHEGGAGKGIAAVSMMGYLGFLAGPPLIGGLSHLIGLPGAFSLVVIFALFIAIRGGAMLRPVPN
ncbi:MFS transporter [Luteolibacter pohnpeiensis]|uniref:MFS transporter n=1 Tax=Luteolibacter pohnpeiensis TaxID=454153 RepID=A0A934VV29_9BACT|nr:MFS transporter [Luteolibacter pohnpeiensis]MBK1881119.1 MFS transporter [Luteolibacter pohnpeiensis]